jgi:hypothetical protein
LIVHFGRKIKILKVYNKQAVLKEWTVRNVMDGNKDNIILLFIVKKEIKQTIEINLMAFIHNKIIIMLNHPMHIIARNHKY